MSICKKTATCIVICISTCVLWGCPKPKPNEPISPSAQQTSSQTILGLPELQHSSNARIVVWQEVPNVMIRAAILDESSPIIKEPSYITWQANLKLNEEIKEGEVNKTDIEKIFNGIYTSIVGSEKSFKSIVIQINDNIPLVIFSNQQSDRPSDVLSSAFNSGSLVTPYTLLDGRPQTIKLTVRPVLLNSYEANWPGNLAKLANYALKVASLPTAVASVATDAMDFDCKSANALVSSWLSDPASNSTVSVTQNYGVLRRIESVEVVLFSKEDDRKTYSASVILVPVVTNSLISQENDEGRPDFSNVGDDLIYRLMAKEESIGTYVSLLDEDTRANMKRGEANFYDVCQKVKETYAKSRFNIYDSNVLLWSALKNTKSRSKYDEDVRNNASIFCPGEGDVALFEKTKLPWGEKFTANRKAQEESLHVLSGIIRFGRSQEALFTTDVQFYQACKMVVSDVTDVDVQVDKETIISGVQMNALLRRMHKSCGSDIHFGEWSYTGMNEATAKIWFGDQEEQKKSVWIKFDKATSVNADMQKVAKIEFVE